MIKRIIDVSEPAYLRTEKKQLLIDREGTTVATVPIEDLGVLILQHPAIAITQGCILRCQQNNVILVFCDERRLPYSVILPIAEGHSLHSKVLREQVQASLPARKRLWQQIVKRKIREQSATLQCFDLDSAPLRRLETLVKSGDPGNCEAQAARIYWRLLMGDSFRRDSDAPGVNALLNYGYAVMRAMTARALVGSGLHPALGLHHHNQYDGLCLADDLMEPFRPWVDFEVRQIAEQQSEPCVDRSTKQILLGQLNRAVDWKGEKMPLMVASHHLAADLRQALGQGGATLHYPKRIADA